jgi:N-acetylmuramoyl-L-alanine amidase
MPRVIDLPSDNHAARDPSAIVDTLVLHHTAQPLGVSLDLLRFGAVSAHYLVDANGDIYRLVDEARVAWHAGLSWWRDRRGLNATSIGIEIVNLDGNLHAYPDVQQAAVIGLCRDILGRHPAIEPRGVVAHSDIAPQRKDDPGTLFFWRALAAAGVGLWSEAAGGPAGTPAGQVASLLRRFGYPAPHRYGRANGRFVHVEDAGEDATDIVEVGLADIVTAFQRHYRPARVDGVVDAETLARLRDLLRQAGESDG